MSEEFIKELEFLVEREKSFWNKIEFISHKLSDIALREILDMKYEIDTKRNENGEPIPGSGRFISYKEKMQVYDYMVENNLPMSKKIYYYILRAYINNEITFDKDKKTLKYS